MNRGFTLIELLVVIAIIGVIATFSIVGFSSSREKARLAKAQAVSAQNYRAMGDDALLIWEFDECSGTAIFDRSERQNGGTITNGAWSTDTPNGTGCSLQFSTTGYVDSAVTSPTVSRQNFTSSVWFKTTSLNDQKILYNGANGSYIQTLNGALRACLPACSVGTKRIDDNKWHLAVTVGDSNSIRIYLDGNSNPEFTMPASATTDAAVIRVGAYPGGGYNFTGYIDQVRIYNRALTVKEIHQMYVDGVTRHLTLQK
jgi:prepilin-type N-terminal cleavage/methylation domain-containing protein